MANIDFGIVDRRSMHLYYDKLYTTRQKRPPLKALTLLTDLKVEELREILSKRRTISRSYTANIASLGESLYKVSLQRIIGLQYIKNEVILDAENEGAWIILTDADSYFITHVLERFFEKLYPMVSRMYLNYSQMCSLLENIRESAHASTTQTFFTIKRERRKPTKERIFPQKKETEFLWGEDVDEEISRVISEGFIVKVNRLDFLLTDERNAIFLKAQITRKGLSKLMFGSFSAFYQNVVLKTIDYGRDRRNFYDKRERSVDKGVPRLHPLQINYTVDFRNDELSDFAKKISASYSTSVIHGGNPYFVANLCDYEDGSSFGVAVLGNAVTVTPLTRATPAAVSRLLHRIQEIMGDGDISSVETRVF